MIRNMTRYSQRLAGLLLVAAMVAIAASAQTKDLRKAIPDQPAKRAVEEGQAEIAGRDGDSGLARRRADTKSKPEPAKVPAKRTRVEDPLIKQTDVKTPKGIVAAPTTGKKAVVETRADGKERGDLGKPGGNPQTDKKAVEQTVPGGKERGDLGKPGGKPQTGKKLAEEAVTGGKGRGDFGKPGGPTQDFSKPPTRPWFDGARVEAPSEAKKHEEKKEASGGKGKADFRGCAGCRPR